MSVLLGRPLDHAGVQFNLKRHILPPVAGLLAMLLVYGAMNVQLLAARYQYTFRTPNIHIQLPDVSGAVKTDEPVKAPDSNPRIVIPKISVEAPVVYDEPSRAEWAVQLALRRGVLHYNDTAMPGKKGNAVFFGHSSGYPWAPGDYKFVFTMLEKVEIGDEVVVDYEGTRHIYKVTSKKVVDPNEAEVLRQTENREITLITCTPVGTSKQRLVVTAELQSKPLD